MFYPIGGCQTQALIKIADVTLRNIKSHGNWLLPGVIRCNETEPCTGFVFDNVQSSGWWSVLGINYISENIIGTVINSKPDPGFGNESLTQNSTFIDWRMQVKEKLVQAVREYLVKIYSRGDKN